MLDVVVLEIYYTIFSNLNKHLWPLVHHMLYISFDPTSNGVGLVSSGPTLDVLSMITLISIIDWQHLHLLISCLHVCIKVILPNNDLISDTVGSLAIPIALLCQIMATGMMFCQAHTALIQ